MTSNMTWGATPYLRTSENASACATMTAPKTMLLASLMAVAVSGFVPDWKVRRPINVSKGSHSFYGLLRTGGNDSELSRSGKVRAPQYWTGDQHLSPLRMGFGESPDRGHAIGSHREMNGAAGERNHACRRRRSTTSMTAESSTSIVKTTSFPLQTSAIESATRARQRRTPFSPHGTTSKPSTHDRRPECDAPFPSPCGPNR